MKRGGASRLRRLGDTPKSRRAPQRSASDEGQPGQPDRDEDHKVERGRERTETVELTLRQIAARRKEQVGARSLRRDGREEVRRQEQQKREWKRRHAHFHADVEEHAEERKQMRRLADEEIVQKHVRGDQEKSGGEP